MQFGEKLKDARQGKELTQEAVAKEIGVSRQSLSNWENDRTYPDLASVLKLSDLYGLSLDDLLREDMALRRKMEARKENVKKYSSWLHDFALLLIASNILLNWMGKTTAGLVLGIIGLVMIAVVHVLFVCYLEADRTTMLLRSVAMAMWFAGFMLRISYGHTHGVGNLLWFGGMGLMSYVSYRMRFEVVYYQHMTAFTGFVIALILVFGLTPFVGSYVERGEHIEGNPFNSRDYRVTEVLAGEESPIPMVYLGSTNSVYLDWPGRAEQRLDGKFTYITQPEGATTKGVWEMLDKETLYRVTVEVDNSITMTCMEGGLTQWRYCLERAPTMGCTILDVLGSTVASTSWYYAGSFDGVESTGGLALRGKGTIKLSVPGNSPTVTIYEEFRDGNTVEHQTMVLTKDSRGFVKFKRETRQDGGKQTGIYRIPYEDGEFVLVLNYVK